MLVACPRLLPLEFTADGAIQWFVCHQVLADGPAIFAGPLASIRARWLRDVRGSPMPRGRPVTAPHRFTRHRVEKNPDRDCSR